MSGEAYVPEKLAELMFALEDLDRAAATRVTTRAINVANWPYSMCGLGFGPPGEWTPAMRRHGPVMWRALQKSISEKENRL